MLRVTTALAALACLWVAGTAQATTLQPIGNFESPVYVTSDPGNPERLFVVERTGKVVVAEGGATSVFADLGPVVECEGSCLETERGLLSIALAPDFDSSGRLYADYANGTDGTIHVVELRASGSSAPLSSRREIIAIPHPLSNHNGGQLQFGPEGMLFVSTGDGGGGNDTEHNAQNLESPLGKLLRLNPSPSGALPYTVPAGNPFATTPGDYPLIWSYGLRNPFRFSFDRQTGAIYIGDVGQGEREEVDSAAAPGLGGGADYGWNCREGTLEGTVPPAEEDPQCATPPAGGFVGPIFDYGHEEGRCAIIGGYVVRDPGLAGLFGRYLYGDYCSGEIRSFDPAVPYASDRSEGLTVERLVSFGEDSCGRLYAVAGNGVVSRLGGATPTTCPQTSTPHAASFIGIKAHGRRVRRNERALITAWVSPCNGRKGEQVKLFEGPRVRESRHLDRACTAQFRPRIHHGGRFRAYIAEDTTYVAAISRRLKIKIDHRRRARR